MTQTITVTDKNDALDKMDEVINSAIVQAVLTGGNPAKAARIAILSHIKAEGWQLVPKVATDAMIDAFNEGLNPHHESGTNSEGHYNEHVIIWYEDDAISSFLEAAPKFGEDHE